MKTLLAVVTGLLIVCAAGGWYWLKNANSGITFRTEEAIVNNLVPTISATGTIEPQESVDVGAQVAGKILTFGKDLKGNPIDYGSPVNTTTLLATIDRSLPEADYATAAAALAQAKAGVTRAVADLKQMEANLAQKESDWKRAQPLKGSEAISQTDYDTKEAAFKTAAAMVEVDKAIIEQARASVIQAEASKSKAEQNLGYCTIMSPVEGVIIDRRVNVGQTVVSSLNAPSLFLIAKDLTQVQVLVSVNEADIGHIHPKQAVSFTVDAYPGEVFHGTVGKVRLMATMTQNVVTYTVEVNTPNLDGRLLPYLTANVRFEVENKKGVLLVPNGALRWYPSDPEMVAPDVRAAVASAPRHGGADTADSAPPGPGTPMDTKNAKTPATTQPAPAVARTVKTPKRGHGTVWIVDGKFVRPIKIRTGATDDVMTEVILKGDELKEHMKLVVGEIHPQTDTAGTTNPFAPQPMWGKKGR